MSYIDLFGGLEGQGRGDSESIIIRFSCKNYQRVLNSGVPVISNNPNYRKKFDAFRIVDDSGHEPLKEAISCALGLRQTREELIESVKACNNKETRLDLILALSKYTDSEFSAWIKVAEFVYAKPKQAVELSSMDGLPLTIRVVNYADKKK